MLEILEEYRIGNLDAKDKYVAAEVDDPYAMEPSRSAKLVVQSAKPFNGETPAKVIAEAFITPNELFYTRNHMPVPMVDPDKYRLQIVTPDGKVSTLVALCSHPYRRRIR